MPSTSEIAIGLAATALGVSILLPFFLHHQTNLRMAKTEQDFSDLASETKQALSTGKADREALQARNADLERQLKEAIDNDGGMSAAAEERIFSLFREALQAEPVPTEETPSEDAGGENTDGASAPEATV
jgi:enoyl-CoA hydratase/carnithine racemase